MININTLDKRLYDSLIESLSKKVHEANREYCIKNNDYSQKLWEEATEEIKNSARSGVKFFLEKQCTPEQQHEEWKKFKISQGYVYGEVKDDVLKTHPCIVEYSKLPEYQRVKDMIFQGTIINELSQLGYCLN